MPIWGGAFTVTITVTGAAATLAMSSYAGRRPVDRAVW